MKLRSFVFVLILLPVCMAIAQNVDVRLKIDGENQKTVTMIREAIIAGAKPAADYLKIDKVSIDTWVRREGQFFHVKMEMGFTGSKKWKPPSELYLVKDAKKQITRQAEKLVLNDNMDQLGMYYERRDDIIKLIEQKRWVIKMRKSTGWVSLITGIIASGAYAFFAASRDNAYDNYLDASGTSDALDYKEQFQLYNLLGYVSLGVAATGIGLSAISFLSTPSVDDLEIRLIAVDKEIALLKEASQ